MSTFLRVSVIWHCLLPESNMIQDSNPWQLDFIGCGLTLCNNLYLLKKVSVSKHWFRKKQSTSSSALLLTTKLLKGTNMLSHSSFIYTIVIHSNRHPFHWAGPYFSSKDELPFSGLKTTFLWRQHRRQYNGSFEQMRFHSVGTMTLVRTRPT